MHIYIDIYIYIHTYIYIYIHYYINISIYHSHIPFVLPNFSRQTWLFLSRGMTTACIVAGSEGIIVKDPVGMVEVHNPLIKGSCSAWRFAVRLQLLVAGLLVAGLLGWLVGWWVGLGWVGWLVGPSVLLFARVFEVVFPIGIIGFFFVFHPIKRSVSSGSAWGGVGRAC